MMIEVLSGLFRYRSHNHIVVDVNGVGYGVEMPLSVLCDLPALGSKVDLWIYTYVRENALRLFGFLSREDRIAFEILLSLNGVGPAVALAILSTMSVNVMKNAVLNHDIDFFMNVPGIGKQLAEKIIVNLKPKLKKLDGATGKSYPAKRLELESPEQSIQNSQLVLEDVKSALENLGFKEKAVVAVLAKLEKSDLSDFQQLLRFALRELGSMPSVNKKTDTDQVFKSEHL